MTLGMLPPSDTDSDGPVVPLRMLSSSVLERAGLLAPIEPLLPGKDGTELNPATAQLPAEGLEGDAVLSYIKALLNTAVGLFRKFLYPLPWLLWWDWMRCQWGKILCWIIWTSVWSGIFVISLRQLLLWW